MSHLIEEYAKNLGVKIGKPILNEHFFPILDEKYITIYNDEKTDAKHYEYFPQVISLIKPYLIENKIKIFQIKTQESKSLDEVDCALNNLTKKQIAFILKKSKLYVGSDGLFVHMASIYDTPIVALYSNSYIQNTKPVWSSEEKIILLDSKNNEKPSFSQAENPKTIRNIKPEKIAESILSLLKIKHEINFKTLKIGSSYHEKIVEVVPNFKAILEDQKDKVLNIRVDILNNHENLGFWLSHYKCNIITSKMLPLDLLAECRANIKNIQFKISGEEIPNEYFENLKNLKLSFDILCEDLQLLSKLRNFYFDFKVKHQNLKKEDIVKTKGNYFFSNKILVSNGQIFPSEAHLKINKKLDTFNEVIYDDDVFWKDAEHFYIYDFIRNSVESTNSEPQKCSRELEESERTSI